MRAVNHRMAYLDPRSRFNIPKQVRRWFDSGGEPVTESWQQQVFADVGQFLFDHRLDPTPDNYDLAFQYRAAANARLVAAIRAEIDAQGLVSSDAAERIFTQACGPSAPDALSAIARQIETQAQGLTTIARQSKHDARNFQTALMASRSVGTTDDVLELTAKMVARTREAELRLRSTESELGTLRSTLAEAQRVADVDPLTELPNRRAFKRDLEGAIAKAVAARTPLSLAFCDIDHFKRVNDAHGHETGDRVLRYIASLLAKAFADDGARNGARNGCVGRFGGEEFVIMIASALGPARDAVDACRAKLGERHLYAATDGASIGAITFSAGVTTLGRGDGTTELLRRADEALYRAKNDGRDRVVVG